MICTHANIHTHTHTHTHTLSGLGTVVGPLNNQGLPLPFTRDGICRTCSFPLGLIFPVSVAGRHLTTQTTKTEKQEVMKGCGVRVQQILWEGSDPSSVILRYLIKKKQRLHSQDLQLGRQEHLLRSPRQRDQCGEASPA